MKEKRIRKKRSERKKQTKFSDGLWRINTLDDYEYEMNKLKQDTANRITRCLENKNLQKVFIKINGNNLSLAQHWLKMCLNPDPIFDYLEAYKCISKQDLTIIRAVVWYKRAMYSVKRKPGFLTSQCCFGMTPLMFAGLSGNNLATYELLKAGADPMSLEGKHFEGRTTLDALTKHCILNEHGTCGLAHVFDCPHAVAKEMMIAAKKQLE